MLPGLEATLAERYDIHPPRREADPQAWLARHGAGFTGYFCSARNVGDAAKIAARPNLCVISSFGVGLDAVDLDAARARGIAMGYTLDVLNNCVADTAMLMLLLDAARGGSVSDRFVRRGDWLKGAH